MTSPSDDEIVEASLKATAKEMEEMLVKLHNLNAKLDQAIADSENRVELLREANRILDNG
jgi:exonuclease VII small subunit